MGRERSDFEPPKRLEFKGDARTYFGIWLTNIVFTLLTLGIYSAWATVRTRRYFYGNTYLDGYAFDYTAKPTTILKGRAIAFAILLSVAIADYFVSGLGNLVWLAILPFIPWLLCRSLRFRARVTMWRNVRFHWRGSYGGVFVMYFLWPLVAIVSLGFLAPFAWRATRRYIGENLSFGRAGFSTDLPVGPFYNVWVAAGFSYLGLFVISLCVFLAISLLLTVGFDIRHISLDENVRIHAGATLIIVGSLFPLFIVPLLIKIGIRRPLLNGLSLQGGHRFSSNLSLGSLFGVLVINTLAIIVTLGFAYPWAAMRLWRIQAEAISVIPAGPLDSFIDQETMRGDVVSSEFAELEGFEFGL